MKCFGGVDVGGPFGFADAHVRSSVHVRWRIQVISDGDWIAYSLRRAVAAHDADPPQAATLIEMQRLPLIPVSILDPRSAAEAAVRPIRDAVNIPFDELSGRTHELPPRERIVYVANAAEFHNTSVAAAEWLHGNGRRADLTEQVEFIESVDARNCVGRLWTPSEFLVEVASELPAGRALDIACGAGRDAVWLASLGWRVTGLDILPDALALAAGLAAHCAAAIEPVEWTTADVEDERTPWRPADRFDLITVFRFLHRPLFSRLRDWLNPGGSIVCETFTTQHRVRHGRPSRARFVLKPGELRDLCAGFEIRQHSEEWRGEIHTARIHAIVR